MKKSLLAILVCLAAVESAPGSVGLTLATSNRSLLDRSTTSHHRGAADAVWGEYYVGGNSCNYETLRPTQAGGKLYVDFDTFRVDMPAGEQGDGLTARKTCTLRVRLTAPAGYALVGFRQIYRGGVLKSAGSSAQLNIRYNIGAEAGPQLPIVFEEGRAISPDDPDSVFEETYSHVLITKACGASGLYGLNMSLTGTRASLDEHLHAGLDQMQGRLVVIPEFAPCLQVLR